MGVAFGEQVIEDDHAVRIIVNISFKPAHHFSFILFTGYQVTGSFYTCASAESQAPGIPIEASMRTGEALALSGKFVPVAFARWQHLSMAL